MSKAKLFDYKPKDIDAIVRKIEEDNAHFVIDKVIDDPDSKAFVVKRWEDPRLCNGLCEEFTEKLPWERQSLVMFGKVVKEPREVFYCGEKGVVHTYSGKTNIVNNWEEYPEIKDIRDQIFDSTGLDFNACLFNKYNDGSEYIGWHSDKEITRKNFSAVATLSLGTSRNFFFKSKKGSKNVKTVLESGDLVLMFGNTQYYYMHTIPKQKVDGVRISITLRHLEKKV